MSLKGEKRLPLGVALVPPGQVFMLIKLNKVPKCPAVMEMEGTAVSLDASGGGLTMGIAFTKPRADFAAALRGMVASRTTAIPTTLPPKTRRRPEAPSQNEESFQRPAPARPAPVQEEAPRAPEEAAKAVPEPSPEPRHEPEPPAPPAAAEPAHEAPKNEAILRLKKRSRAVVALAPSAAFSDILKDYLQEEGYGRVLVTHSVEDLLVHLQQPNLGLLLLDGKWGTMEGLEFVSRLKNAFHDLPPIILAAEDVSTSIVLAARRVGVAQMLVKPYAFDQTLSSLFIQQMGLS
jgi:CheY-like chemotaxis protein